MRRLCNCTLLVLVTLVRCAAAQATGGQGGDVDRILNRFPGYHLLTSRERDSETRAFIFQHFPKDNPSIVHADFDGDGYPDYAMLLKPNKSGATKLVIFFCSGNDECKSVFEHEVTTTDATSAEIYIRPVPTGSLVSQTEAIDTKDYPSPVRLKSTGIEVTYFGKVKLVVYWNNKHKKMEWVQTED